MNLQFSGPTTGRGAGEVPVGHTGQVGQAWLQLREMIWLADWPRLPHWSTGVKVRVNELEREHVSTLQVPDESPVSVTETVAGVHTPVAVGIPSEPVSVAALQSMLRSAGMFDSDGAAPVSRTLMVCEHEATPEALNVRVMMVKIPLAQPLLTTTSDEVTAPDEPQPAVTVAAPVAPVSVAPPQFTLAVVGHTKTPD